MLNYKRANRINMMIFDKLIVNLIIDNKGLLI
ncbi:hypothetical protein PAQU9191_01017 [Photobacterium aquimaris]|uniref:Uncharacterized protein n=1 Tax=Photobacterium aquimaris TaxID=512643 RepID=A0A1Y6KUS2_9GAMM|nr:hypothetical protein PAQU9191_01017 [Photobacterium aquimaris]